MKKMKILAIHHSHTDIGYTDRQEKIERYHVDFIKQAIDILEKIHKGEKKEWKGFKWTCENTWQIENFLKNSEPKNIKLLEKYIKSGEIDVSGNYLNMTELVDERVLREKIRHGVELSKKIGKQINSAMTADVNGYAWGYSEALYTNGIKNLFSCIHPHHGMFPLNKKQSPFYWQTPEGNRILVWVGEHYHFGNELNIVPHGGTTYTITDELADKVQTAPFEVAEKRIYRYIESLLDGGYDLDFVPLMVSGGITDNAPANGRIMDFINKWNSKHGSKIEIEMSTIHEFFKVLRENGKDIPTYSGDWNDWWADGVGSTPSVVKLLRDAQRKYNLAYKLDPEVKYGDKKLINKARNNIMRYAEHTWGYSSSVIEPWGTLVNDLELRKTGYAIKANENISRNLDEILKNKGEVSIIQDREKVYKIINPHDIKVKDIVKIYLQYWEHVEGHFYSSDDFDQNIEVLDEMTGESLHFQSNSIARGKEIEVLVELDPKEERTIIVKAKDKPNYSMFKNYAHVGAEGVKDIAIINDTRKVKVTNHYLETPFYLINFDEKVGINSIIDKTDGKDIIKHDNRYAPFTTIYERTDIKTDPIEERRLMGRNRKSISTKRYFSKLRDIQVKQSGEIYSVVDFTYEIEGLKQYIMSLKVYHDIPKITLIIKLHKKSFWEPENLYVALPFTTGEPEELFFEKTGCIIRPGIDQLPYTNKEFYLLQNGLAYVSKEKGVIITLKDTPLITMGDLSHHIIELCSENDTKHNQAPIYSWLMNNYWETNFKVDLAGFYEFEYNIFTSKDLNNKDLAIKKCQVINEGMTAFRFNNE